MMGMWLSSCQAKENRSARKVILPGSARSHIISRISGASLGRGGIRPYCRMVGLESHRFTLFVLGYDETKVQSSLNNGISIAQYVHMLKVEKIVITLRL
jgi:hypothetical protein